MTWTRRTSGLDPGAANGVCWSHDLALFAAVGFGVSGTGPTIVTSPDGTIWTDRVSPFDDNLANAIAWDHLLGLFIAVGANAAYTTLFATSPDGVTWTDRGSPYGTPGSQANCVAVKPSTGLALIGTSAYDIPLVKTTDGLTYTPISSPFDGAGSDNDGGTVVGLAYSPALDRWFAIGWDAAGAVMLCYSDDDGATWTTVLTDPVLDVTVIDPLGVYWDQTNSRFWFAGANIPGGRAAAWSPDGTSGSWTAVATPFDSAYAYAVANCGGLLMGLGGTNPSNTEQASVSSDGGDSFEPDVSRHPFGLGGIAYGLAYSPDLDGAVIVGSGGIASGLPSSPPPQTIYWTGRHSPFDGGQAYGVCWAGDLDEFLAVGQGGGFTAIKSGDGLVWADSPTPFDGGGSGFAVVRDLFHSLYVVAGVSVDATEAIITSPDGATWTGRGNPFVTNGEAAKAAIRVSDGAIFVAGADYGYVSHQQLVVSTDDATTWSDLSPSPTTGSGFDVAVRADGLILLVGQFASGPVAISTDGGATWTYPTFTFIGSMSMCAIRESDGALVVGDGSELWVSTDSGATWTITHPFAGFGAGGTVIGAIAIRQSDGALVAVGWQTPSGPADNAFAISTDSGATWTTHRPYGTVPGTELECVAIRTSDGAILVGGTGGGGIGTLAISTDNGATWTSSTTAPPVTPRSLKLRAADDLILVAGSGTPDVAVSTDGGATWVSADPFTGGAGQGCAIRESDGALIVVGVDGSGTIQIALSTDSGATWGAPDPFLFSAAVGYANCIACKQSTGATVLGSGIGLGAAQSKVIAVSADSISFTLVSSPFDHGQVFGIDYSPSEDLWIASGVSSSDTPLVCSSTDDGATWTVISTHDMENGALGPRVYRDEANGRWWLLGPTVSGNSAAYSDDGGATWTDVSTPFDASGAEAYGADAASGRPLVLGGFGAGGPALAESLDNGLLWTGDTSPLGGNGAAYQVVSSPDLIVAAGYDADFSLTIATGSLTPPPAAIGLLALSVGDTVVVVDAATLAVIATVPVSAGPQGVAFSSDGSLIAVACSTAGTVDVIETTGYTVIQSVPAGSDPWSVAFSPDDSIVAVVSQTDGLFVIDTISWSVTTTVTLGTQPSYLAFSPGGGQLAVTDPTDNTVTILAVGPWTVDDTVTTGTTPVGVAWSPDGAFLVVVNQADNTLTAYSTSSFSLLATVTVGSQPSFVAISQNSATVVVLNTIDTTLSIIETAGWTVTDTPAIPALIYDLTYTVDGLNVAVAASEGLTGEVRVLESAGWSATGEAGIGGIPNRITASLPSSPPPPDTPTPKSLKNTWRWVVVGLDWTVKSYLDKLATNVQVEYVLDDAAQMTCDLPSDNEEIYRHADDDHPRIDYGRRVIFGLRREEPNGGPPWVCRFAGLISILQDQATEDEPVTHLTAHDPWMWAKSLPVLNPDGSLLGQNGLTYTGKTGNFIARDLIANAYAWIVASFPDPMPWSEQGTGHHLPNDGQHNFIDIDSGTFDTTDVIPEINFAQGISVGEAWTQLCQTGSLDIVLTPVYGQPGVLCVMNVYATAGKNRPSAVFGWDMFPRNLVAVDHLLDGTLIENWAQFFAGNLTAPLSPPGNPNHGSIDQFGPYFVQKSYPAPSNPAAVSLVALAEVELRKKGKQTLVIDPAPGLAPDPFTQYFLGDVVPVWAGRPLAPNGKGNALRGGIRSRTLGTNRVYGFQIDLSDDLQETVVNLLLTDPNATV